MKLDDIKEVFSTWSSEAVNERLETGNWRLLETKITEGYQWTTNEKTQERIVMPNAEVIYVIGGYK